MTEKSFQWLKVQEENDETILFIKMDASYAIAIVLNQAGKPVAFFSRTLNATEQKHSTTRTGIYPALGALHK